MDYGTLAQLSSPGQTPLTSGVVDPVGYQRWMNLSDMQQQSLQRAMPLAEMNSEQQALQHEAFKAAQPARMNQSTLANMNTASAIENQPAEAELKKNTTKALNEEQKRKMADVLAPLNQFADAMDAAKTPAEQEQIWKAIDMQGITLPNGYKLNSQDKEMGEALLKASRNARSNTPALANKKELEEIKGNYKLKALREKGMSDMQIAEFRAKVARELQDAKLAKETGKPLTMSQREALDVAEAYPDVDDRVKYYFLKEQATAQTQKLEQSAGTAQSVLSGKGVQVPSPQPILPPVPSTPRATAPQAPAAGKPLTEGDIKQLSVGSVFDTGKTKSPIKSIQKNKSTGAYRLILEDGTIYP